MCAGSCMCCVQATALSKLGGIHTAYVACHGPPKSPKIAHVEPAAQEPACTEAAHLQPAAVAPAAQVPAGMMTADVEPAYMEAAGLQSAAATSAAQVPANMETVDIEPAAQEPASMEAADLQSAAATPAVQELVSRRGAREYSGLRELVREESTRNCIVGHSLQAYVELQLARLREAGLCLAPPPSPASALRQR